VFGNRGKRNDFSDNFWSFLKEEGINGTWRCNKKDMMDKAVFNTDLRSVAVSVEMPCTVVNWCCDVKKSWTEKLNGFDV